MKTRLAAIALTLGAAVSPRPALTQPQSVGRILGVFDDATGAPLAGVEVIDIATGTKTITSDAGMISLAWLARGTSLLQIRKIGYASKMVPVTMSPSDTVSITVVLVPNVQRLPEVVTKGAAPVTGKMSAFEERRRVGTGHFLTRADLAKFDGQLTENALRMLPGNAVTHGRSLREAYVYTTRGPTSVGGQCYATVVLDGAVVYNGSGPRFDIDSVPPEEIEGIEFYSGVTAPAAYGGTNGSCGVLLIWTR